MYIGHNLKGIVFSFNFNVAYNSFCNVLSSDILMDEALAVGNTGDHQNYHYKFFLYKTSPDVDMASPLPYGSSWTTGGNTCGHALRNVLNIADTGDDVQFQKLEINFC